MRSNLKNPSRPFVLRYQSMDGRTDESLFALLYIRANGV